MTQPTIVRCPDQHYRKAVFGIGPYISDYPEQCLIACVVQGWCPKYVSFIVPTWRSLDTRCITRLSGGQRKGSGGSRSLKHTIRALETYELGELWEKYGLVGDLIVHHIPSLLLNRLIQDPLAVHRRLSLSEYL